MNKKQIRWISPGFSSVSSVEMIENYVCAGFEFDAAFDSGNLGKVELSKVYNEGKFTEKNWLCLSLPLHVHVQTVCRVI